MSTLLVEDYIRIVLPSLSPYHKKKFKDGWGYSLACPFCSCHQRSDKAINDKCAVLSPITGSRQWFFACQRGIEGGLGNDQCKYSMGFAAFLKKWNPPLHRNYLKQREAGLSDSLDLLL